MARRKSFPFEPGWRALLSDLGANAADVLRRAQLPADLLSRSDVSLSTDEYFRYWASLEAEVDDPLFPLRIAEVVTTESFMPPVFAAMCSQNLATAADRISHYKRLIAPMALRVDHGRAQLSIAFEWLDAGVDPPKSLVAAELAFIVRLARIATRAELRPLEVVTPHPPKPASAYKRFFGVAVTRGQTVSLSFSKADAERPFLTANESMWSAFEPSLRQRLAQLDEAATVGERVRATLLESLPSGQASMDMVARRLAMSKRTLQRRLSDEGTGYQELLSRTREDLALHYLSKTSLSCAEISFLLGFEDPNSFFRAFHEWTGATPEGVRQSMLH